MTSFAAASECARKLEHDADSQDVADLAPQSHCTVLPLKLTSRGTQIKELPLIRNKRPQKLLAASLHGELLLSPLLRHRTALQTTSRCNLEIKKGTCGGRMRELPVIGHLLSALSKLREIKSLLFLQRFIFPSKLPFPQLPHRTLPSMRLSPIALQ